MSNADFCAAMRMANEKQRMLLAHEIHRLLSNDNNPLQIFFTGPAVCGKGFVIKLFMEIYNRFLTVTATVMPTSLVHQQEKPL